MKTKLTVIASVLVMGALFAQTPSKPTVAELIAVLGRSDATLFQKARACQQLGEFGTKEAVPALAALLSDPVLGAYARSGLEGIPDPSAAAALHAALPKLKGNQLIGAVNSLGVLKDPNSVEALGKLALNPNSGAAKEALWSLGRIGTEPAIAILRRVLISGPESLRPEAAAGCLLAAEAQLAADAAQAAVELYDTVRAANVPTQYRIAATRGAVHARRTEGIDFLAPLLRSEDREIRYIALHASRELAGAKLAGVLRAELETARPEMRAMIVAALVDCCRDSESLQSIRSRVSDENSGVRAAALKALGKLNDPNDAQVLLKAVTDRRSSEEVAAAVDSLSRIEGSEVDGLVVKSLASAGNAETRIALIDVIDARPPYRPAAAELLRQAGDPDHKVGLAALRTLKSLVGVPELPALIALTKTYQDGPRRAEAESVLLYASTRSTDPTRAGEILLAELKQAREDLDRASWIRTLSAIGYAKSLPAVAESLKSRNAWLVGTTVDALGNWPSAGPVDDVLGIVEKTTDAGLRARALNSAVAIVGASAERRLAPDSALASWFQRLGDAARSTEEKRLLISGLGRWRSAASLRFLAPYLDNPEVRLAAVSAASTVAQAVVEGPDYAQVKTILPKLTGSTDRSTNERIEGIKQALAAAESKSR